MIDKSFSGCFLDRFGTALRIQLMLAGMAATAFYVLSGRLAALSALFGGAMGIVNVLLLTWRRCQADSGRALTAGQSLWVLYRSAIERFALVVALFALGMGVLRLEPLPLLTGFIAGQLGLFVTGTGRKN